MVDFFALLVLVSIVAFILGMFKPRLVIRWGSEELRTRKKVAITYLGLMLFSFVMFGITAPKIDHTVTVNKPIEAKSTDKQEVSVQNNVVEKTTQPGNDEIKKQQQAAFKDWYSNFRMELNNFDDTWKIWENTFTALGEDKMDRYEAYDKLKSLKDKMSVYNHKFYSLKPPNNLSKEHQEIISDALSDLSTTAYYRQQGVEKALNFLDDMKPSSLQEAKGDIQSSNNYTLSAAAKIAQVKQELGSLDN